MHTGNAGYGSSLCLSTRQRPKTFAAPGEELPPEDQSEGYRHDFNPTENL